MLSKVLRRADALELRPIVFPHVKDYAGAAGPSMAAALDNPNSGNSSALLERIRALESSAASEARAAFEAGRQEAENSARSELQPVLQRLAASTSEVLSMRAELRHHAEADVVRLALMIAKRVLHRQLMVDESALTALARVTFERLTRSESYTVIVHPRFAAAVASALPPNQIARVTIEPDPGCAPGTLTIHSSEGTIDASIDAQLDEISRGLADRLLPA